MPPGAIAPQMSHLNQINQFMAMQQAAVVAQQRQVDPRVRGLYPSATAQPPHHRHGLSTAAAASRGLSPQPLTSQVNMSFNKQGKSFLLTFL